MKNLLGIVLMAAMVIASPVHAKKIAGVEFPPTLDADGTTLNLNGAGLRSMAFMKLYVGGLYMEGKGSDAAKIIAADEPMAMKLHIVSGMITSEKMEDATMEGFEKATDNNIGPISAPIESFISVFREEIKKGDEFDIVYIPGKGVDVYKNGTFKSTVSDGGMPFKEALFGIWIGDDPVQEDLKNGMLGK